MHYYAGVILVSDTGGVLLQRRDNNPQIADPGKLSIFAGRLLPGESKEQAALRELQEETGLDLTGKLTFLQSYQYKDATSHIFVAHNILAQDIALQEGQGVETLQDYNDFLSRTDIAPISAYILQDYYRR